MSRIGLIEVKFFSAGTANGLWSRSLPAAKWDHKRGRRLANSGNKKGGTMPAFLCR